MKTFKGLLSSLLLISFVSCSESSDKKKSSKEIAENSEINESVIYGEDGRRDLYEITDANTRKLSSSVVSLFEAADVINQGQRVALRTEEFGSLYALCPTEKFRMQKAGAFCSGALVGPDLILTAGHCVRDKNACANTRFIFGFNVPTNGPQVEEVTKNDLYKCKSIVTRQVVNIGADYAIIRLDRKVVGRTPLKLNRTPNPKVGDALTVMGYPTGLPLKITLGGKVRSVANPDFIVTNLDTYGGNSGSPVFSNATGLIEGVLVRGENDFVSQGSCNVSYKCTETGCRGEDVTRVSKVLSFIPEVK